MAIQMIDDLVELAVTAAIDVEMEKAARKHRKVRIVRVLIGLFFLALVVGAIYVVAMYS